MHNRTGLIPLYSPTGDGAIQSTSDNLRNENEVSQDRDAPVRDAVNYLLHNALSDADEQIDIVKALNVRWNISWDACRKAIEKARPLADRMIEAKKETKAKQEAEKANFDNLAALFESLGLRIEVLTDGYRLVRYVVSGMTESQVRTIADILMERADSSADTGGDQCQR